MRSRILLCCLTILACVVVVVLPQHLRQPGRPFENPSPPDPLESEIQSLATPAGKVEYLFFINPGGPVFEYSEPMNRLVERGRAVQPRIVEKLSDPRVRDEVALILARVGDKDALLPLIESLPAKEDLNEEERFFTTCLLYALWQLTGLQRGISSKYDVGYTPDFRDEWRHWYEANEDYLYTPSNSPGRVLLDLEAKLAGKPTTAYRRKHPWISYEEVRTWQAGAAYERKLKDYCFTVLLNSTKGAYEYTSREGIQAIGGIRDPRALRALHAMCTMAENLEDSSDLIFALEDRGDSSSIPFLEGLPRPRPEDEQTEPSSTEQRRLGAIERIRLLKKYARELQHKPLDEEQKTDYMKCLEGPKGVESLIANLRNRDYDCCFLPSYLQVAGYVDRDEVRSCLREMATDPSRDERARTLVHAAMAQLGEPDSREHLKRSLSHRQPGVRLAAAEGLWRLGSREGFNTLLGLLETRPIESGTEGVQVGDGSLKVTALRATNVEYIRSACTLLGEMGDRAAAEPLKRLLPLNLNGTLAGGGNGTGWSGRPDAVALARLGDYSGTSVLRASIREGDPLDVVSSGDFAAIGLKRFIPELLPMLEHSDESKRVYAARDILLLLESGR